MESAYVKTFFKEKVAEIEFYSPAGNSLNSIQLKELTVAILKAGENKQVAFIHLKSKGDRAFCAGASFDELLQIDNLENGTEFFLGFANVINAMRNCGKIIITSIQGKTVGGGVGIAAASDYVFATKFASIKLSELSIGIGPFVIEPAVSRKIGLSNFTALTLNPTTWKTANWAQEAGLYQHILEDIEELNEEVEKYIKQLSTYNSEALNELKKVLWSNTVLWDELLKQRAKISGALVLSEETKKALSQFKNK